MKIDGKALAQAMLKEKEAPVAAVEAPAEASVSPEEDSSHLDEMAAFSDCVSRGDHSKAHEHLAKMVKALMI
jgi:hypothetical protein